MFLNFAAIATYICVGAWTQSYQAFVLRADTAECIHFFEEYSLQMTKFSFQMRNLNGHTIDSNLFVLDNCLLLKYTVHWWRTY